MSQEIHSRISSLELNLMIVRSILQRNPESELEDTLVQGIRMIFNQIELIEQEIAAMANN
jgi:hypothetical protein